MQIGFATALCIPRLCICRDEPPAAEEVWDAHSPGLLPPGCTPRSHAPVAATVVVLSASHAK